MTEIERKALEILNDVHGDNFKSIGEHGWYTTQAALLRAIEQHEAFRQEVSDAVKAYVVTENYLGKFNDTIGRFIIASPDPLVEAVKDILNEDSLHEAEEFSEAIRAALAKRGQEIRKKKND